MNRFSEFFAQFGSSLRTKNLVLAKRGMHVGAARYLLAQGNKHRCDSNITVGSLPKEYIRLCPWEGEYLFGLAAGAQLGMVEIGRFHGGSTFMLAWSNRDVAIYTVDIAPQNDELLKSYFTTHGIGANVEVIVGDSQRTKYPQVGKIDLLFIDGDHSYEGCTADLENWYPNLVVGGHIVLHDCYLGSLVRKSVIDFLARHSQFRAMQLHCVTEKYWNLPAGSLMHLIKMPVISKAPLRVRQSS